MGGQRTSRTDAGFATAAALGAFAAFGVLMTALVLAARVELVRVAQDGAAAQARWAAQAGLAYVQADLAAAAQSPRGGTTSRDIAFSMGGFDIVARLSSEASLADVNQASESVLRSALEAAGLSEDGSRALLAQVVRRRASALRFDVVDQVFEDVYLGGVPRDCLYAALTVFGGATPETPGSDSLRPHPGARFRATASASGPEPGGVSATFMTTGMADEPIWVMDWRRARTPGETCDG